jgi:outer membrane protein assembly factor BamB
MNLPLVDFATRTPTHTRSLIHGESDRTRAGTALAVLVADPTGRSAHWPLALAAYRHLWAGYKGHAPWRRVSALLAEALQGFAAERDFLRQPDLVAAFVAVDGTRLEVAALSTALVLVRQGRDVLELGPEGFRPVPEIGALFRDSGEPGLWRDSLALGAGAAICLVARAAAARVGVFRLREALAADSAADLLSGLGAIDEPILAARLNRVPQVLVPAAAAHPAAAVAKIGAAVESAPPAAISTPVAVEPPAPVESAPSSEPVPWEGALGAGGEAAPFLVRSGRRHRPEPKGGWLDRLRGEPAAAREPDLFMFAEPEPLEPAIAAGEPASAVAPPQEPELVPPAPWSPWSEPDRAAGEESDTAGALLPAAASPADHGGIVIPARRARQQLGQSGGVRSRPEQETYFLRRWFTWAVVGLGIVAALVVIILIGRFLTGGGPAGPRVQGLEVASTPGGRAESRDEDSGLPPAPAFSGASWTKMFKQSITSSPLLARDRVVVGGRDGNLYALGMHDGAEAWRLPVGSGIGSSPAACGSLAVVGTYNGDVVAADQASGSERWRFKTNGKIVSSPAYAAEPGLVVIGSHDHQVYALKASDGSLVWKAPTGGIVWASPAIAGDRVYIGSHDRVLYCLDLESGRVNWKAPAGGTISTTAAIASDRVIVGTTNGQVAAFALADGGRLWAADLRSACGSAAVIAGDLVLVGTDGGDLVALQVADGERRYRVHTGGAVKCRPAVDQGLVWITSYDGRLRALDAASGEEKWSFAAKGRLYSSPAVLGRTAFFGSMDGSFYAATWPEEENAKRR